MSLMRRIPFPQNLTRTVDRRPTRVAYALPTFFTAGNMFFGFVSLMNSRPPSTESGFFCNSVFCIARLTVCSTQFFREEIGIYFQCSVIDLPK